MNCAWKRGYKRVPHISVTARLLFCHLVRETGMQLVAGRRQRSILHAIEWSTSSGPDSLLEQKLQLPKAFNGNLLAQQCRGQIWF
jgi:hypothetical protein